MLKLIPPGRRRGNRFWIARGRVGGRLYEVSTGSGDKGAAERFAAEFAARVLKGDRPAPPAPVGPKTFRDAALAYAEWRRPSWSDVKILNRLIGELGKIPIAEVTQADLATAAARLYPGRKPSSLNRLVITPASAILHYAYELRWRDWLRVRRYKEPPPETRHLDKEAAARLIAAAGETGPEVYALLVILFTTALRITDAVNLAWERIDLRAGTLRLQVRKTGQWQTIALTDTAIAALASLPQALEARERSGRVFPWPDRTAAYRALKPVTAATGIAFTPHMARHSVGAWLSWSGASLRTTMDALGHRDPKSSMRYQAGDLAVLRGALDKATEFVGKKRGEEKKPKAING